MGMEQMIYAPPETWLNGTGGGGGSGGISSRSTATRAAAATAHAGAARPRGDEARRPGRAASPSSKGVVTRRRQDRHVRRADRRQDVQLHHDRPATAARRRQGSRSRSAELQARRHAPAADRHPGQGRRQVHVHPERAHPGDVARPLRPPARARRRTRRRTTSRQRSTRSSIKNIPGAQVVRINNFVAVVAPKEYDAIQAAAQLKVVWKSDPKSAGLRQLLVVAPPGRRHEHARTRARYTTRHVGNVDTALCRRGEDGLGDLQVPLQQPHADRPAVRDRRRPHGPNRATVFCNSQQLIGRPDRRFRLRRCTSACEPKRSAASSSRARARTAAAAGSADRARRRSSRRRSASRCACSGCAGTSTAGTATARRTCTTSRSASTRPARSSALDWTTYGQAGTSMSTTPELARHGARGRRRPANGGPNPSDDTVYSIAEPARAGEDAAAVRRLVQDQRAARSERAAVVLRERADRRRARVRAEHGPDRVPQAEHRRPTRPGARWLAALDARRERGRLEAEGRRVEPQKGEVRDRSRLRVRHLRGSQVGMVADIEVDKKTGKIVAKHLYVAQNNGITISPDVVANQMSGAAIQGLSRALYEQAHVHQGADHEHRLGHVPDPALQGFAHGHGRQRRRPAPAGVRRRARARTCPSARRSPTRSSTRPACGSARRR